MPFYWDYVKVVLKSDFPDAIIGTNVYILSQKKSFVYSVQKKILIILQKIRIFVTEFFPDGFIKEFKALKHCL